MKVLWLIFVFVIVWLAVADCMERYQWSAWTCLWSGFLFGGFWVGMIVALI